MANNFWFSFFALLSSLLAAVPLSLAFTADQKLQVYIVYMGAKKENETVAVNQHRSILEDVILHGSAQDSLVYSYKRSFNGFAAKLTEKESRKIAGLEGVVSVFPSVNYQLHTTRSWDFVGFGETVNRVPTVESDIIVGVFDTGIWPESESFNDDGLGPTPKKWKGTCTTKNFTCNKKVIGARVYPHTDSSSPRDYNGHGSHTASTVAGRTVQGASYYGIAEGDARGGVPSARIAVYKVCDPFLCSTEDILAAFDDAIADGVDVISISIGFGEPTDYTDDAIAIGSFHAMANGILTSNSAGNSGPTRGTITSLAPWLLSVAATSIDRKIISKLTLGNDTTLVGTAINTFSLKGTEFPLITGADAKATGCDERSARACFWECLDPESVKGKILLCERTDVEGSVAHAVGALGLIDKDGYPEVAYLYSLPATSLSNDGMQDVASYINKTKNPQANILKSESAPDEKAPTVVSFSSRGPNSITPQILKPDISAPGVDILAAWSPAGHLTEVPGDERSVKYNIVSGTSMACPHAAAAAAYVKSFHPDWSPAAIKSALMTTAIRMNETQNKDGVFAYGAGNINPVKAINPGLVFDASKEDYIQLLCQNGYTTKRVRLISGDNSSCPDLGSLQRFEFNYAALAVKASPGTGYNANFSRTVTNVGKPNSNYTLSVDPEYPLVVSILPSPRHLNFTSLNQKLEITFQIYVTILNPGEMFTFQCIWSDGEHDMRFPVYVVYMGAKPENDLFAINQHSSILQNVILDGSVQDSLVYNYKRSFNGFAANLTDEESRKIAGLEGVVSVFPSVTYQLQTTRSWDFIGFPRSIKRVPAIESDIIVGVLDTGLWPESESFNDEGLGPPPKKWKGACATKNFTCNNKVIGARVYPSTGSVSARDLDGHGTHTASTIAGHTVHGSSLYGIAEGDVRGGVPSSRIAVYKVCSSTGCSTEDILAGFDDAIADGVDLISASLGPEQPSVFTDDPVAIGSFHAMANGILTSNSAGNTGPGWGTVSSVAPWILTVAATSIDRKIISKLVLGNGSTTLSGNSINTFSLNGTGFPLITGADAKASGCDEDSARGCYKGCLDPELVKGKILLCESADVGGSVAKSAGAVGLIARSGLPDVAFLYSLPATSLSADGLQEVASYINKTKNPQANILKSETVPDEKSPTVVSFSSRGPNTITSTILKPDVSAPGVEILAAWSPVAPLTNAADDKRSVKYNIISGTSMACPHATAAAAYVKSFHPDWSPAAIKSALMTTATRMKGTQKKDEEFAYGAGNINPVKAINPGLVFDASKEDNILLLCQLGYSTEQVTQISGENSSCPDPGSDIFKHFHYNYPALTAKASPGTGFNASFSRTVTNVGKPNSNYTVKVEPGNSAAFKAYPRPNFLNFTALNQKLEFTVIMKATGIPEGDIDNSHVLLSDGEHEVRFPIVVYSCKNQFCLGRHLRSKSAPYNPGQQVKDRPQSDQRN
ncbi:hypothetical protein H6P81_001606 [Aristolochia fimbriata]|uniref:Cucumisin n=1 Tax=Aristolochia fimbriata TaxID=158543 RepID=A0AAV7FBX9_ARIFI|nr:hypothetical protein H6P81_001606 [Aristolochia fimbriata]